MPIALPKRRVQTPPGDDWRAVYATEARALARTGAERACWLAIGLVPAFGVLDWLVFPEHVPVLLGLRLGCVLTIALILLLVRGPVGERHPLTLGMLVVLTAGFMTNAMTLVTGRESSPYYAGTNLVLLAMALMMPWPPMWTLVTSAVLVGGYAAPILVFGVEDGRMLANNLAFLLSTALIAVISNLIGAQLRQREVANRTALEEALQHKSDFMARMSHELRTPLHVIIGYADVLLEQALAAGADHARPLVERVRSQGIVLHRLISELLDYAKVEAGKMDLHNEPIPLEEVLWEVADNFTPLTERKGLELRTRCVHPVPDLMTDRQRLEQILTNLVGNAIKFTEAGSITLEARALAPGDTDVLAGFRFLDQGRVAPAAPSSAAVLIVVRDTGIGIRPSDLMRLSEDFLQLNDAAAKYGGTGLGLSISRRLAALLGGRIAVRSLYGDGSTFALLLPAEPTTCRAAA
jgi:signal transduction histidine kinase